MTKRYYIILWFIIPFVVMGCGGKTDSEATTAPPPTPMVEEEKEVDPLENKGIGPIASIALPEEVDAELAVEGEALYGQLCTACHKADQRYIGPSPQGILERRTPEWIMNMMLNPVEMVEKDPIARQLLIEYNGAPMADQNLTEPQARAILEYFRTL